MSNTKDTQVDESSNIFGSLQDELKSKMKAKFMPYLKEYSVFNEGENEQKGTFMVDDFSELKTVHDLNDRMDE